MHATKDYRLKPEAIEQAMRQEKLRSMMSTMATTALAMYLIFSRGGRKSEIYAFLVSLVAVTGFAIVNALKKKRLALESFVLTLGPDFVQRRQKDYALFEIRREEVRSVIEKPGKGLSVRTVNRFKYLEIPEGLDGFEEVSAVLRSWASPQPLAEQRFQQLWVVVSAAMLVFAHFASSHLGGQTFQALAHAAAAAALVLTYFRAREGPDVDESTKSNAWIFLAVAAVELFVAADRLLLK